MTPASRTWSAAVSDPAMTELEALMDAPLAADRAPVALASLCGDLWLYGAILDVRRVEPTADVRPLVAMHLEFLADWTVGDAPCGPWDAGVRERMSDLAGLFRDAPLPPLGRPTYLRRDPDAAEDQAAGFAGDEDNVTPGRFATLPAGAPGVYVSLDTETGEVYRTEIVTARVVACPEPLREAMTARFRGRAPGPA